VKQDDLQNGERLLNIRSLLPTMVTLCAMLAGFISILVTIRGTMAVDPETFYRLSAKLIMLAMILDGLDGNLARWLKGQSAFGAELDTYVDLTAFGIAPAVLIFAVSLQSRDLLWQVALPSAVALSGVVRLARFKVKDPLRGQGGYAGLPITANAGWVAMFVFMSLALPPGRSSLEHGLLSAFFLTGILVFVILQVTLFRYPKPTKNTMLFIPCIILVSMLFCPVERLQLIAAVIMLVLGVTYIAIGPLFVKGVEAHKARKEARQNGQDNDATRDS
jgi:CDP-diacylglycerol--serine O-phosphatidyltransferase